MNKLMINTFRLLVISLFLSLSFGAQAQEPAKPTDTKTEEKKEQADPLAPEPAPPLPAGMTGPDANDPRAKLKGGLYDAEAVAKGMTHLLLLKKPDAFQLGTTDPDSAKVQNTLGLLGMSDTSKMPKPVQLVRAQLAFANSDLAFRDRKSVV